MAAGSIIFIKMEKPGLIKIIITGSLLILFQHIALSQADTLNSGILPDSARKSESPHSLYSCFGYGSNMIYLGSTISEDQPYGYASITYGLKDALYLSATAVHLDRRQPFTAFWIGAANFNHVFNSWFDMSAGYYRYQVAAELTDTLFTSFSYGDLSIGIDWRLLYTKISAGTIFSTESKAYFQVRNSRFFQTPAFFKNKAIISFDPYINLLFGPLTTFKTTTDTITTTTYPFRKNGFGGGTGTRTTISSLVTNSSYSTRFGLMELDFGLPVTLTTNRVTIEAEPSYVFPVYKDLNYPKSKGFVFMLSCYIRIF
jgi:hypothetical protein